DAAYRDEMTLTLRRVTGLVDGLHFDDCDLPRHWPSEDGAYRDALIEARALLISHPLAQGAAGAMLRRKLEEAIDWLGQPAWSPGQDASLPAAGERAEGFKSMGAVTLLLKLGDEAITAFDAAMRDDLEESEAQFSKARLMAELGRREAAIEAYEAGLRLRPGHAPAHYNRGNLLLSLGRAAEAVGAYERALRFRPSHANTHYNKGCALQDLHRFADAVEAYREAIAITPDFAEAHANLGNVLNELGRFAEAVDALDAALDRRADLPEAHFNRGLALQKLLRHDEALAAYDEVLRRDPGYAEAHGNRAVALAELRRLEEALEAFDTTLGLVPGNAAALSDRGNVLKDLGRYEDALASYLEAQRLQPDLAAAHYNEAFPRLLLGELGPGLRKYEWRWRGGCKELGERGFDRPQWQGGEVAGKTVLVHAEQGFGDSIQFCRYVPMLAARGARVVLQAPQALLRLLSGLEGVSALIAEDQDPPEFDFHCPLMSLAAAFGTELDSVPAAIPYLRAEPALERSWRDRLADGTAPKIGLVWAGSPLHPNDVNRSMPFSDLAPLNSVGGVRFYSLQGGQRQADLPGSWRDLAPDLGDFTETAAALSQLDLLITVDTASAHLAGALGRPTWVLLPFVPDWRWMIGRSDSPWYSSLRLFRQSKRGDWAGVMTQIVEALGDAFPEK
ncbi:MAG TPA: tetratricopeptide repeat-containing glycosyltransferase family protein, partial [Magnetospirillaceae bacterium]|nr:tetratricopeptide repeat-containing glycosyltransferase family protein [Magnetospirillaceae bacterium]